MRSQIKQKVPINNRTMIIRMKRKLQILIKFNKNQQKINQTKQITMRNFQETTPKEYVLAKFQPGNILLINRYTKDPYNYFEVRNSEPLFQQLSHPHLLRPLFLGNGLLYPKSQSNMMIELQNRKRAFNQQLFTEDELINTFGSIFECVDYLHANNLVHGHIHLQNIVLVNGQIKLRDWLIQIPKNVYYVESKKQNRTKFDDFVALGQILAQFATLKKSSEPFDSKDVHLAIESIIDVYSKNFIFTLLILLKNKTEFFKQVIPLLMMKDSILLNQPELNAIYSKIKSEKASKVVKPQPVQKIINIMPTPKKSDNILIQSSPNKKFNITQTTKRSSHRGEDTQNKKVLNEQVKKRQIQKITKIIQRSNAFVNELMARKNNSQIGSLKNNSEFMVVKPIGQNNQQHVLKKISGKNNVNLGATLTNMSMYTVEGTKKVKQTATTVIFSPNKRLRTMSRKK